MIGGTSDPSPPYSRHQRVTRQLGNARLLTYDSDGYTATTSFNPCVLGAVAAYVDGVLPAEGAVCVPDPGAFGTPATRPPRAQAAVRSAWSR